jgi:hypothetical protein
MRTILCMFLTVALCVISGCYLPLGDDYSDSGKQPHPEISQVAAELRGPHYAKLNSIGCLQYNDMEMTKLDDHQSDFDTIDNLIREKRCFVIPTDTDIFIIERVKGDIVKAKLGDPAQLFYTVRKNLVAK